MDFLGSEAPSSSTASKGAGGEPPGEPAGAGEEGSRPGGDDQDVVETPG